MKISNIDPTKAKNDVPFEILVSRRIRLHCMLDSNRLQDKSRHLVTFFTKTMKLGTYFIEKLSFKQEKILTLVCLWCNLTIHCIRSKITIYNQIFNFFFSKTLVISIIAADIFTCPYINEIQNAGQWFVFFQGHKFSSLKSASQNGKTFWGGGGGGGVEGLLIG